VINAEGYISTQSPDHDPIEHRRRLEAEGIHFDANEKVDFKRFGWSPTPDELIELHLALTL
jgi:methylated-DNA-protein-cysteine methyltransferase-like protein